MLSGYPLSSFNLENTDTQQAGLHPLGRKRAEQPSGVTRLTFCSLSLLWLQELGRSPFPVVRNNIMVALSDMLIQYTALVDAHMPRLAGCIR